MSHHHNHHVDYVDWYHHHKAIKKLDVMSTDTLASPGAMMIVVLNTNITIFAVISHFFLRCGVTYLTYFGVLYFTSQHILIDWFDLGTHYTGIEKGAQRVGYNLQRLYHNGTIK